MISGLYLAGKIKVMGRLMNDLKTILLENNTYLRATELCRGCIVYMTSESGLKGWGNPQCVSWYSQHSGELSLFGHNEHYKDYHIREIIEYPIIQTTKSNYPIDDLQITLSQIDDVVCEILRHDGPDRHIDGHEVITDFINSIINDRYLEWRAEYFEKHKIEY